MRIDSVHFYVTDATNTANWFINCLGFRLVDSYQDDNSLTVAIANKSIFLVVSSPINNQGAVAHYLASHAEGIVDISFSVNQLQPIINNARHHNLKILQPIKEEKRVKYACFAGWSYLQHTIIESTSADKGYLLPNGTLRTFKAATYSAQNQLHLTDIDHVVLNVASGKLAQAVAYYQSLFQFEIQQTFEIKTQRSGLYSQALIDAQGKVQFNINEPSTANSQIQEFIELNGGAGIQHLAFKSTNLIADVAKISCSFQKYRRRSPDVAFLPIPLAYYSQLKQRLQRDLIQFSATELQSITQHSILLDWNKSKSTSLLMQIFTQPILQKPTFFLEFIERRNRAIGFGEGNFNALFAAVEQEQIKGF